MRLTENKAPREMAQIARCMLLAKATNGEALHVAQQLYGPQHRVTDVLKAAVDVHGTTGTGSELSSPDRVASEFADSVRPLTVLGKLQTVGVPFRTPLPYISTRSQFSYVQERNAIPAVAPGTADFNLGLKKIAGLVVMSKELLESSRGEEVLRREMIAGSVEAADTYLLDATAGDAGRPAAINYNTTTVYDGTLATTPALIDDIASAMVGTLLTAGSNLAAAAFVTSAQNCASLALLRDPNGGLAYPGMTINGGTLAGLPVYASAAAPADGLTLVDGSEIVVADDSEVVISATDQAFIDMDDAVAGTSRVSIFQTDSVALRMVRYLNWQLRREFVSYCTNFELTAASAPTV